MRFLRSDGEAGSYALAASAAAEIVLPPGETVDSGSWTLIAWVRPTTDEGTFQYLAQAFTGDWNVNLQWSGPDESDQLQASYGNGVDANNIGVGNPSLVAGAWRHVALVNFAGTLQLYVSGSLVDDGALSPVTGMIPSDAALTLFTSIFDERFAGDLRAPAIFDRALGSAEIESLFDEGMGHDLAVAVGNYQPDPSVLWDGPDLGGYVANRGSAGECNLTLAGGVTVETVSLEVAAHAFPTGTHSIRIIAPSEWPGTDIETWALGYGNTGTDFDPTVLGECPRITTVAPYADDLRDLVLHLDAALVPGVLYTLAPPTLANTDTIGDIDINGPRRDLAIEASPDDRVLVDIDAPFIRPTRPGGDFTINEARDYGLSSGLATVEKAIWDLLLSPKGARYWDPEHGTDLRHKALRPLNARESQRQLELQVETIPYVRQAVVQLLWDAGHMVISVRADTDFGRLVTQGGADQAPFEGGVEA